MEFGFADRMDDLFDEADVLYAECLSEPATVEDRAMDGIQRTLSVAESRQWAANREEALLVMAVGDTLAIARAHPEIYVPHRPGAKVRDSDAVNFSERAAVFDLSVRLHLSEQTVRRHQHVAEALDATMPLLRDRFLAGVAPYLQVRTAVEAASAVTDPSGLARYDSELADAAGRMAPGAFRRAALALAGRLATEPIQARHDRALDERRVEVEPAPDAMAWMHLYIAAVDAVRIDARLSRTAVRMGNEPGQNRTKAQLKADAAVAWLAGDGTPTAAIVRPYLLVNPDGTGDLQGFGLVDPAGAGKSLRDSPSFGRLYRDPIRPARLTMDRNTYRPNKVQRDWLTLRYGLDPDATDFVSVDAEIDHVHERQHGGMTEIKNLLPLKPRLHRLKSMTGITFAARPRGGIRVTTPTGYDSDRLDRDRPDGGADSDRNGNVVFDSDRYDSDRYDSDTYDRDGPPF
ncbi:HNH endonuclease signature motif containing protein [Glaciibacter flavus]|uniref:HNH endonuclease signature motif containing protein n=1 Tax=Orlajensenia flava TaxID=2565934 RepID=UPI003B0042CF